MNKSMKRRSPSELLDERYFHIEERGYSTPCWIWTRAISSTGYGSVYCPTRRKRISAHIAVYEERIGPLPDGLEADHLCRERPCVNPAHIEPVTRSTNIRRGDFAKLAEHEYDELVELHAMGTSILSLVAKYGLSVSTIRYHLGLISTRLPPRLR